MRGRLMEEVPTLFYSITWREVEKIKRLLRLRQCTPNCCDNNGVPAIVHCIRFRNKLLEIPGKNGANEIVKLLLTHGAKIDQFDQYGWTAAMWAAYNGSFDCLKTLVEFGADLMVKDKYGNSALTISTLQYHEDCVQYIKRQILKRHKKEFQNLVLTLSEVERTAYFLRCIADGDLQRIEEFIKTKECIPNRRSADGTPVLSFCLKCMPGYGKRHKARRVVYEIFFLLIRRYQEVNLMDRNGWTASMWAAKFGLLDCLELLKDVGADFDLTNDDGDNCLMVSIKYDHSDCAGYLSTQTKEFNHQNNKGLTALMIAVESDLSCLEAVLKAGRDTEGKDANGYTALMHALRSDMCSEANKLLDYGADVNVLALDMATPLGLALKAHTKYCQFGSLQAERHSTTIRLLELNADRTLSPRDQKYLHSMLRKGNFDIVQKMILNGCQPLVVPCKIFASNNVSATPLEMAIWCKQASAARFFIANRFLTLKDICAGGPLYRQLGFSEQNVLCEDGDTIHRNEEMRNVAEHLTKGPLTLYTLSFVVISSVLNQTETKLCLVNDIDSNTDTTSDEDEFESNGHQVDGSWSYDFDETIETSMEVEENINRRENDDFGDSDDNNMSSDVIDSSIVDGLLMTLGGKNSTVLNRQILSTESALSRPLSRKEKVELLPLPSPLQKALLFQTPTAYVDFACWQDLPLDRV